MKIITFACLMLVSRVVGAENYPAAYFQPKVIFMSDQNAPEPAVSAGEVGTAENSDDVNYPAANFQPKVIFSSADENVKSDVK